MIQRIQTLWLALTAICTFLMPWGSNISLPEALTIAIAVLSVTAIFMFRRRNYQKYIVTAALILALSLTALMLLDYFREETPEVLGTGGWFKLTLPPVMSVALWLALRGIARDEKLVKSYDRLR